jgi:hypothetical protein
MSETDRLCVKPAFLAWSGIAVATAGVFTVAINAGLTPLIDANAPYAETAASAVFLWRQALSAFVAVLLLLGSVGLHLRQAEASGRFGSVAFIIAFVGSALLLANEWTGVFVIRDLAIRAPDGLEALEAPDGLSLFDVGAMIAFGAFTLGWIAFAVSMLRAGLYSRKGPILLIVGFFAVPILTAALPDVLGVIIGNALLGGGWVLLGRELQKAV